MSELRSLLRDAAEPFEPVESPAPFQARAVLSPDVEPLATSPFAFDTAPKAEFFAEPVRDSGDGGDTLAFTPPSRLFAEDDTHRRRDRPARSWACSPPLARWRSSGPFGGRSAATPRRSRCRAAGDHREDGGGAAYSDARGRAHSPRHDGSDNRGAASVVDSRADRRQGRERPHLPGGRDAAHLRRAPRVDSRRRRRSGVRGHRWRHGARAWLRRHARHEAVLGRCHARGCDDGQRNAGQRHSLVDHRHREPSRLSRPRARRRPKRPPRLRERRRPRPPCSRRARHQPARRVRPRRPRPTPQPPRATGSPGVVPISSKPLSSGSMRTSAATASR